MIELFFIIIFVVVSIISSGNKAKTTYSASDENTQDLEAIFNEVMKNAGKNTSNTSSGNNTQKSGFSDFVKSTENSILRPPTDFVPQQPRTKKEKKKNKSSEMTAVTSRSAHQNHDCNDVNYDKLDSLMGKDESFDLGVSAFEDYDTMKTKEELKFKMEREDLLKSFIMSEVLQRYDINRIYSRIPAVKSDD